MSHRTALSARVAALTADDAAIATFLARYSGSTRPTYESAMRRFGAWCADVGITPLSASRAQLEMFSHWLADEQHLKPSTIAGYLSVLGSFYRIAVADNYLERDPMVFVRKPKVIYDEARTLGLDRMQLGKLIQHARAKCPKRAALVSLMGLLGLRVSEACSVRIEDFQEVERGHRVLRLVGKGGKPATIPLPPQDGKSEGRYKVMFRGELLGWATSLRLACERLHATYVRAHSAGPFRGYPKQGN